MARIYVPELLSWADDADGTFDALTDIVSQAHRLSDEVRDYTSGPVGRAEGKAQHDALAVLADSILKETDSQTITPVEVSNE